MRLWKELKRKAEGVVRDKSAVGDMGHIAYLKDSEGNVVGLWEDAKKE
jgi:predicted enzyme related to lactoylglutathione lyase